MTAATLKDVLDKAVAGRYAVAGLVVLGWEDAVAYVQAAAETGLPVVLQAGPGCRKHTPIPVLGSMFRYLADRANVPVVCHIDHAYTIDECREGIDHGFTSVMFDGSKLPLDENIETTARIADIAHKASVSVEGEIGIVGYFEGAESAATSPEDAARFDAESGADAIAISIGNVHLQTDQKAEVDMDALRAIEAVTSLPLVIHGGSGIPVKIRQELARESRIAKFNIGTELRMVFGKTLRETVMGRPEAFDRISLLSPMIEPVKCAAIQVIRNLGPDRKTG